MRLFFLCLLLVGCSSPQVSRLPASYQINWPERYDPENSVFFVHNEIEINASAETVWNIIIQAETWPEWYEGAFSVKVKDSQNGILEDGSYFSWKTMGLNFTSVVKEFVPYERLSWESYRKVIKGYHAWLIIPTPNGVRLITDESQHGFLAYMQKAFQPKKLHRLHDIWLRKIKEKAENEESPKTH